MSKQEEKKVATLVNLSGANVKLGFFVFMRLLNFHFEM